VIRAADALRGAAARIERLDAEVLLADLLGVARMELLLRQDQMVDAAAFGSRVARRAAGEPVAYITGHREFWSLDFAVTPAVLIPRPDSETLIEAAVAAHAGDAALRILDLGTGSGALLLAALHQFPVGFGVGIDRSAAAVAVAAANAMRLELADRAAFVIGDWGTALDARFDLILANPPYVEDAAPLAPDVRDHEPASALFAGAEGLDAYRIMIPTLPALLAADGTAQVEIGADQAEAVTALAVDAGLCSSLTRDLAGHARCLTLRHP
jgi:release factor glutamine methyltransferase